jgi:hypothetical protein
MVMVLIHDEIDEIHRIIVMVAHEIESKAEQVRIIDDNEIINNHKIKETLIETLIEKVIEVHHEIHHLQHL